MEISINLLINLIEAIELARHFVMLKQIIDVKVISIHIFNAIIFVQSDKILMNWHELVHKIQLKAKNS